MIENTTIPEQQNNLSNELHYSYTAENIEDAEDLFIEAKDNLLNVNEWVKNSGLNDINIILLDPHKKEVHRQAHMGDHIKIEKTNNTYWLHIDILEYDDYPDENKEAFTICLRPIEQITTSDHINKIFFLSIERINAHLFSYGQFTIIDNRYKIDIPSDKLVPITILPSLSNEEWGKLLKNFISFT